jgi:hypothetical protein
LFHQSPQEGEDFKIINKFQTNSGERKMKNYTAILTMTILYLIFPASADKARARKKQRKNFVITQAQRAIMETIFKPHFKTLPI